MAVSHRYGIGRLEVTVAQWVTFLNTADPTGSDRHDLYDPTESRAPGRSSARSTTPRPGPATTTPWPIRTGPTSPTASPTSCARPLRQLALQRRAALQGRELAHGFARSPTRVRLSPKTSAACTTSTDTSAPARPAPQTGFVVPSQDEWIKAAYYDPKGGGTYSYWKYPTNAGVFGDGTAPRPPPTTLNPKNGDVTNAATQPVATYPPRASGPDMVPGAGPAPERLLERQPLRARPDHYAEAYQGSLGTVGQAKTRSPWAPSTRAATRSSGPTRSRRRRPATAARACGAGCTAAFPTPPATRCGSGGRTPAQDNRVLQADLPLAGLPDRDHRHLVRGPRAATSDGWPMTAGARAAYPFRARPRAPAIGTTSRPGQTSPSPMITADGAATTRPCAAERGKASWYW